METVLGLSAFVATTLWVATLVLLGRKTSRLQAELITERGKLVDLARLPDALARLKQVEDERGAMASRLQELTGKEQGTSALLREKQEQVSQLERRIQAQEITLGQVRGELAAEQREHAVTQAQLKAAEQRLVEATNERSTALEDLNTAKEEVQGLQRSLARSEADLRAERTHSEQVQAFLKEAESKLGSAFLQAASKVFDEKAVALEQRISAVSEASKQGLDTTLKPFAEKVTHLQGRIEAINTEQTKDRAELQGKIQELANLNREMASSTHALTKALKGNAQVRGAWGEMILDTVLKASGLQEGLSYVRQPTTHDEEDGKRRRPDVVVTLPGGKQLVVDSKVNLVDWADYNNAATPEEAQEALIRHTAALRKHVLDLADKNYPALLGSDTLEVTILFVPIEGALGAALSLNPSLQEEALKKRICFASPNTLMAMLRVVERLWTRDTLQKQIGTIADEAGKVLDALILFKDRFGAVEAAIRSTQDKFDAAKTSLTESPQSLMNRAQRLVAAGAKGKKAIPEELQPPTVDEVVPLLGAES
jgi:DNA recombination protein RmuC